MLFALLFAVTASVGAHHAGAAPRTSHQLTRAAAAFRVQTYKTHPCLAQIIDHEDGAWDPTISYGGGHGRVYVPYGLVQANPGTKMASIGRDWRTSRATQLRWAIGYAHGRYGSECGAWAFWQAHWYW